MTEKTDREIVEAATPGPWEYIEDCGFEFIRENYKTKKTIAELRFDNPDFKTSEKYATAQFIAHFNPFKVASMLDQIEALEKRVEELEKKEKQRLELKHKKMWRGRR